MDNELLAKLAEAIPELTIDQTKGNPPNWYWTFRCQESADIGDENSELAGTGYFESPLDALLDFASRTSHLLDDAMDRLSEKAFQLRQVHARGCQAANRLRQSGHWHRLSSRAQIFFRLMERHQVTFMASAYIANVPVADVIGWWEAGDVPAIAIEELAAHLGIELKEDAIA